MLYRNTKTGVLYDSPCVISGGDWVEVRDNSKRDPVTLEDEDIQLSKMTVKELKALAVELRIDLGEATKKDDIIDVILAAEEEE